MDVNASKLPAPFQYVIEHVEAHARSYFTAEDVLQFFYWINAHHELRALRHALENLQSVLEAFNELGSESFRQITRYWPDLIDLIQECLELETISKQEMAPLQSMLFTPPAGRNPLMQKGMDSYPFYAALCEPPPSDHLSDMATYRWIQGLFLFAHFRFLNNYDLTSEDYVSRLERIASGTIANPVSKQESLYGKVESLCVANAHKSLRKLARPDSAELLSALGEANSIDSFQKLEIKLLEEDRTQKQTTLISTVGLYFRRARRYEDIDERSGGARLGSVDNAGLLSFSVAGIQSGHSYADEDDPVPAQLLEFGNTESSTSGIDEETDDEGLSDATFINIAVEEGNRKSRRIGRALAARGRQRAIAKYNQLLPNTWSQLHPEEIRRFLVFLQERLSHLLAPPSQDYQEIEAASVAWMMILTGRQVERFSGMRLLHTDNNDVNFKTGVIYFDENTDCWRMPITHQTYSDKSSSKYSEDHHWPLDDSIDLEVFGMTDELHRALSILANNDKHPGQIIRQQPKTLTKKIRRLLKRYKDKEMPMSRLVLERLNNFLYLQVAQHPKGGALEAAMLTDNHRSLVNTQLHYASPTTDHLITVWESVWRETQLGALPEAHQTASTICDDWEPPPSRVLGAAYRPYEERIKQVLEVLKERIVRKPASHMPREVVEYHEAYVLYTGLFLNFATGVRAVKDPLSKLFIPPGFERYRVISDKDNKKDYYNTRLVKLPDSVDRQLTLYNKHLEVFRDILRLLSSDSGSQYLQSFLDENYRLEVFSEARVNPRLGDRFNLPLNANRHWLRSRLAEMGCDESAIDALLGHWKMGQEPWGDFSTVTARSLADEVEPYVTKLLDTLGFEPLKSRLQR